MPLIGHGSTATPEVTLTLSPKLRERRLYGGYGIPGPVDNLENHSAPEHLGFEIGGIHLPLGSLPNAKPAFPAELAKRIVNRKRPTDALVHQSEAVVRECLIIHWALPYEKNCRRVAISSPVHAYIQLPIQLCT